MDRERFFVPTKRLHRDQKRRSRKTSPRITKVLVALADLGWEDVGEVVHQIRYQNCHKVVRGGAELFVAPAVEDGTHVTVGIRSSRLHSRPCYHGGEVREERSQPLDS